MLRVIDSGRRGARLNLSITEALRRARQDGTAPDTLRFQHFPPSAIIGRHQLLHREVDLGWVAAHGVETARRMTGGGAIVMGPGLLGWELILGRGALPTGLDEVTALICHGVAAGLTRLGVAAAYRPRNDIEAAGRKVCGTGGYFDGDVLVFQGSLLVELDLDFMMSALHLPVRKLGKRGLAAMAERVTDLRTLLGAIPPMVAVQDAMAGALAAMLGREPRPGSLTAAEEAAARDIAAREIGTEAFVRGHDDAQPAEGRLLRHVAQLPGGAIEVVLKLRDGADAVIDQALVTGDFFAAPPAAIGALEAALRGQRLEALAATARAWLAQSDIRFLGIGADAVADAIAAAAAEARAA